MRMGRSSHRKTPRRVLAALSVVGVVALLTPAAAAAARQQPTSALGTDATRVSVVELPMVVGGIDEEQAKRAGNRVVHNDGYRVLLDGRTGAELARVPTSSPSVTGGSPGTLGVAQGECGISYIYMRDAGSYNNVFEFRTGFDIIYNAFDFTWFVLFDGPDTYSGSWADSGPKWPSKSWTSGWKSEYTTDDGWHVGEVSLGIAYATNGTICFSYGPSEAVIVT